MFYRDHEIRETRQEKAVELEERVEEVLRQGQKDLQETRTKHKKELAKVSVPAFSERMIARIIQSCPFNYFLTLQWKLWY